VIAALRERGVYKAMIVTTVWHTARWRGLSAACAEMTFYIVGAEDPDWHHGEWWTDRKGRKAFFLEGLKTIADYLGI